MNQENVFTSTGIKLLHHTENVERIKKYHLAKPISLQLAPTSQCNLNCSFCSNANRTKHEELLIYPTVKMIRELVRIGLKTVEWTGGGEPLLYSQIYVGILTANLLGVKQGLITNGILLNEVPENVLTKLDWIRVSMNCLDYVKEIKIPNFHGALGFSYVVNTDSKPDAFDHLKEYIAKYHPSYVRIVPNCQATQEVQEENNKRLSKIVNELGPPFFYQAKHFSTPEKCYWGYLKPFVLHNGWVYPCSSVVLNDDSDKTFHSKYKWLRMEDLADFYLQPMKGKNWGCSHCVFRNQNELIGSLLNPTGMEEFV